MRLNYRLAIAFVAVVIFSGSLPAVCKAQTDPPDLQKAIAIQETGKYQDILNAFNNVVRHHNKEAEVASRALFLAGQYAAHSGKTPDDIRRGQDEGARLWRQLTYDYKGTNAATQVAPLLVQLENDIDKRNSSDWRYKIIDSLVILTGKRESFSYGLAMILLACLIKLILLPLTRRQYAGMREMHKMQPLLKELQKKYKGAELSQKQMELYKEHGVNPFSSCIPTLLQMPVLIGIFTAIRQYEFAFAHGKFLWIGSPLAGQYEWIGKNLASPDVPLLVLYAVTNYITMRMTPATDPSQEQQQKTMAWMMSIMFFWMFLTYKWSSAFVLYWTMQNLLTMWQNYEYVYKPHQERIRNGEIPAAPVIDVPSPASGVSKTNGSGGTTGGAKSQPTRVRPRKKR